MSNYNEEPDHLTEVSQNEFMQDFFMFNRVKPERRQVHEGHHFKYNLMMWEVWANTGLAIKGHLGIYTFHRYGDPEVWDKFRTILLHEHRGD